MLKFDNILMILNPFIWIYNALKFQSHLETYRHAEYEPYDFERYETKYFPRKKLMDTDIPAFKLKQCPMCGGEAEIIGLGSNRVSSLIECIDCGLSLESNETHWNTGSWWNERVNKS